MKNFTSKMAFMLTALGLLSVGANASADDYLRISREARTIERKANQLTREVEHYAATPQYLHLASDVHNFVRLSQHITDLVQFGGNLRHIKSDVAELDRTFHHLEGLFDHIERQVARGRAVKCGNTAHVKRLLNNLEDCIHHMQEDIAILEIRARRALHERQVNRGRPDYGHFDRDLYTRPIYSTRPVYNSRPVYNRPVYNPRPPYYGGAGCRNRDNGIGFSIGGGSTRINIRF